MRHDAFVAVLDQLDYNTLGRPTRREIIERFL